MILSIWRSESSQMIFDLEDIMQGLVLVAAFKHFAWESFARVWAEPLHYVVPEPKDLLYDVRHSNIVLSFVLSWHMITD